MARRIVPLPEARTPTRTRGTLVQASDGVSGRRSLSKSASADPQSVSLPRGTKEHHVADKKPPTPAEIVIMAAGGVMLIGSFLPFYEAGSMSI